MSIPALRQCPLAGRLELGLREKQWRHAIYSVRLQFRHMQAGLVSGQFDRVEVVSCVALCILDVWSYLKCPNLCQLSLALGSRRTHRSSKAKLR